MKQLHLVSSLDPRGGGPIEAVKRVGLRLQELGHRIEVAALDDARAAAAHFDVPLPLHPLGPARGTYGYTGRLLPWLRAHAPRFDAVFVHGLWQYHGLAAWRALRRGPVPYFVFPHGMLDPWFRRNFPLKHAKKWLYWPWADYRLLRDARGVLFTAEAERQLARASFSLYRAREIVVPFGTLRPPQDRERLRAAFLAAHPALAGRRLLLFLGRIHPKKGCDLLVEAFAAVAAADPALQLVIAGPDPGGWGGALRARARALGVADRIAWPGMLQGELKWGAFHAAEAFVLPSHQENFGIAVAEALGCGIPVLISDQVNIWREIAAAGAGLVEADTIEGTRRLLAAWCALAADARAAMAAAATACFERHFTVERMADGLLEVAGAAPSPARGAGDRPG